MPVQVHCWRQLRESIRRMSAQLSGSILFPGSHPCGSIEYLLLAVIMSYCWCCYTDTSEAFSSVFPSKLKLVCKGLWSKFNRSTNSTALFNTLMMSRDLWDSSILSLRSVLAQGAVLLCLQDIAILSLVLLSTFVNWSDRNFYLVEFHHHAV